jgi:hypothetical protein
MLKDMQSASGCLYNDDELHHHVQREIETSTVLLPTPRCSRSGLGRIWPGTCNAPASSDCSFAGSACHEPIRPFGVGIWDAEPQAVLWSESLSCCV